MPKWSAPSASLISALVLLPVKAAGDGADSSPQICIPTECHESFGRSNHFRKLYFIVSFRFRAQAPENEGGVGGDIISIPREMISLIFSGILEKVSTRYR